MQTREAALPGVPLVFAEALFTDNDIDTKARKKNFYQVFICKPVHCWRTRADGLPGMPSKYLKLALMLPLSPSIIAKVLSVGMSFRPISFKCKTYEVSLHKIQCIAKSMLQSRSENPES